jgi:hypothetical protein
VPGTVADVEEKDPVTDVPPIASDAPEKVRPGAVEVTVVLLPSPANPVPVMVKVPEAPVPMASVPEGEKTTPPGTNVEAPATVAIVIGKAAATSTAPTANAFAKWRCIRRGLFMVNSLHS